MANLKNMDLENLENKVTYISIYTQISYDFIPFLVEVKLMDLDHGKLVKVFNQFIKRLLNYLILYDKIYIPFEKRKPILKMNEKVKRKISVSTLPKSPKFIQKEKHS